MSHYRSNLRDLEFNLFEVFDRGAILAMALSQRSTAIPHARSCMRSIASPVKTWPRRSRALTGHHPSSTRKRTR